MRRLIAFLLLPLTLLAKLFRSPDIEPDFGDAKDSEVATFKNQAAQGDLWFVRINKLPDHAKPAEKEPEGHYMLAHSESGHHHVIGSNAVKYYHDPEDDLQAFLVVDQPKPGDVMPMAEHMKTGPDRHGSIGFSPGVYRVRRSRERLPSGWQKSID